MDFSQEKGPVVLEWKDFTEESSAKSQGRMLLCGFRVWSPPVAVLWILGKLSVLTKVPIPHRLVGASSFLSWILSRIWLASSSNLLILSKSKLPKNSSPGKILCIYFLSWLRGLCFEGQFITKISIAFLLSWFLFKFSALFRWWPLPYPVTVQQAMLSWDAADQFAVSLAEHSVDLLAYLPFDAPNPPAQFLACFLCSLYKCMQWSSGEQHGPAHTTLRCYRWRRRQVPQAALKRGYRHCHQVN